jgi:hypothetical protein
MQKREAQDSDAAASSGPLATPRVSGEVLTELRPPETEPTSSTRAAIAPPEPSPPSEPSDTLLSAGKPADRLEVLLEDRLGLVDDRLALVDERLRELDSRLTVLEQKKSITAPEPRQKPWLWVAFLIALAVVFQLLHRVR